MNGDLKMKRIRWIIAIFLILGVLGVPGSVFAQETSSAGSDVTVQHDTSTFLSYSITPLLKGGGGFKGIFKHSDDAADSLSSGNNSSGNSTSSSSGSGWITGIIVLIIIIAIIGAAVWYLFLRK